jgi:mannose-6-phosphate isomerase-like protein (cupin superfamily)
MLALTLSWERLTVDASNSIALPTVVVPSPTSLTGRGNLHMPILINSPTTIPAAGDPPKVIDEYIGRVNSNTESASIAYMTSPPGWTEPGQTPTFDEFTVVLKGMLHVEHEDGGLDVRAGQALIAHKGEWVRYSSPSPEGAEYIAVCVPAFSTDFVRRDQQ